MAHWVTAFDRSGNEVGFLVRGDHSPLNKVIYDVLGAQEFNAGTSGIEDERVFEWSEIKDALDRLMKHPPERFELSVERPSLIPERNFLEACLAVNKEVRIYFG